MTVHFVVESQAMMIGSFIGTAGVWLYLQYKQGGKKKK